MWIIRTSAWVRGAQHFHQQSVSSIFPKCVLEITLPICPVTKDTDAKEYCLAAAPAAASCLGVQPRTIPTALNLCNGQRVLAAIQNEICTRAAALSHLHDSHPSSTLASNSFLTLNLKWIGQASRQLELRERNSTGSIQCGRLWENQES